jgi:DNA-binding transcriptional LysR family regulator
MDRLDAMKVFVAALDEGSLAGASRKTGRSAAAVSRAIAFLEAHVGVPLLHRTTRSIKLSEAGERYALACRKVLQDLDEADRQAAGERSVPRGTLTITAPVVAGVEFLRAIVDDFMEEYPTVNIRLYLLDRPVNLIDEGIDLALRISHLADSTLVAHQIGDVRRVVVASPRYLSKHPRIAEPADLGKHQIVAMTHFGLDSWSFPPVAGFVRTARRFVYAAFGRQQCSCCGVVGGGCSWRHASVFVSHRDGNQGGVAACDPCRCGARSHPSASCLAVRPPSGAESACLCRLRPAAFARAICMLHERRIEIVSSGDSAARRKNVCRTTGIRFGASQA